MTRSLVAIGTIGLGGCVVLCLLMQRAVEVQQARAAHPLQAVLQERFARRLARPPRVDVGTTEGGRQLTIRLCVLAGLRKARIVEEAARLAWEGAGEGADAPAEVVVSVTDDGEGETLCRTFARERAAPR